MEGRIHGKVIAEDGKPAVLTLAEQGRIEGEVQVPVVILNGELQGDVYASERVELAAKARVLGNVHYKVVEMRAGATLTGRLIHVDAEAGVHAGPDPGGGQRLGACVLARYSENRRAARAILAPCPTASHMTTPCICLP